MDDIRSIRDWLNADHEGPVVIAGPCSAESREQMMQTASEFSGHKYIKAMRAGIWKPRTRPGTFSGIGEDGLDWLVESAHAHNLRAMTEVAFGRHVESALKAGVDALWIGARTTVSPFAVQEIADALRGVDIPVLVKNPINPDLQLWIGALERFYNSGIRHLAAIHRGFSWFGDTQYRNEPKWEFPIGLKMELPSLEVFCDPSHIAGQRHLISDVSQKALDLEMTGLMIESHPDPDNALSDQAQQLTPSNLRSILDKLEVRTRTSGNLEFTNRLEKLRMMIDEVDRDLMEKLAQRMRIIENIGAYKKENAVTILQLKRWQQILDSRNEWARELYLDPQFVREVLEAIHQESIRIQTDVMNESRSPSDINSAYK